ncbi:MAG: hypothetical protein ACI9S8_001487 [Chlamydiales bacterium]|jgi:hypothetical protein
MTIDEHVLNNMWAPNTIALAGADFGLAKLLGKPTILIKIGNIQESIHLENFCEKELAKVENVAQQMLSYTKAQLNFLPLKAILEGGKRYQIRLLDKSEQCPYERKAIFLEALVLGKAFEAFVSLKQSKSFIYKKWFKSAIEESAQLATALIKQSKRELALLIREN